MKEYNESNTIHFVNLTTGIERYKQLNDGTRNVQFLRIQSTHGEGKHFNMVLDQLDNNFLMNLALGKRCIVYDAGSRRSDGRSRVVWQLIPYIEFVLRRLWFDDYQSNMVITPNATIRLNVTEEFDKYFRLLTKKQRVRLKYFRKFLITDSINIQTEFWLSEIDGKPTLDFKSFVQ
jgi:hypothetical protein